MKQIYKDIKKLNEITGRNLSLIMMKTTEEFGELAQEVNKLYGLKKTKETQKDINQNILEEGVDTIQCVLSLLAENGHSYKDIKNMMLKKNDKWYSKYK